MVQVITPVTVPSRRAFRLIKGINNTRQQVHVLPHQVEKLSRTILGVTVPQCWRVIHPRSNNILPRLLFFLKSYSV